MFFLGLAVGIVGTLAGGYLFYRKYRKKILGTHNALRDHSLSAEQKVTEISKIWIWGI